jgi:hypothetical protein
MTEEPSANDPRGFRVAVVARLDCISARPGVASARASEQGAAAGGKFQRREMLSCALVSSHRYSARDAIFS